MAWRRKKLQVLPQSCSSQPSSACTMPPTLHALITLLPSQFYIYACDNPFINYAHIYQRILAKQRISIYLRAYSKLYLTGVDVFSRLGNKHCWSGVVETVIAEFVGWEVRKGNKKGSFFCLHLLFFPYSITNQPHRWGVIIACRQF